MKLNEMVFVIESWKGITETNSLMTLDDTIEMLKQSGEYSLKETAAIFSELGRTMTEPDWAEVYLEGNKTLFMCYCRDESHLRAFLNKKFNDENVEDVRFDYERCSHECKEKIRLYGITENGEKDKMVEHHYSHMEHQFKQGENLHNFNGKDYKVVELLSPRNLLLMDMSNGNFVVGLGTSLFMRQIKGDNEEPEIGIEWEHGVSRRHRGPRPPTRMAARPISTSPAVPHSLSGHPGRLWRNKDGKKQGGYPAGAGGLFHTAAQVSQ